MRHHRPTLEIGAAGLDALEGGSTGASSIPGESTGAGIRRRAPPGADSRQRCPSQGRRRRVLYPLSGNDGRRPEARHRAAHVHSLWTTLAPPGVPRLVGHCPRPAHPPSHPAATTDATARSHRGVRLNLCRGVLAASQRSAPRTYVVICNADRRAKRTNSSCAVSRPRRRAWFAWRQALACGAARPPVLRRDSPSAVSCAPHLSAPDYSRRMEASANGAFCSVPTRMRGLPPQAPRPR